jgi:hypothetical protein
MSRADLDHPIQCLSQCGFNFCVACIEGLIKSSKDDYMEASDGNNHVKVFLNCPQCRSNLVSTIRDTLILRKVDTLAGHAESNVGMTASELRLMKVLHDEEVQYALSEAQRMEDAFFGRRQNPNEKSAQIKDDEVNVNKSFLASTYKKGDVNNREHIIDPTLFRGLECAMTEMEKLNVTQLMTSGDTSKLANAAEILQGIATRVMKNISKPESALSKPKISSIYNLIEESQTAKQKASKLSDTKNAKWDEVKIRHAEYKAFEKEDRFLKLHPLPARMPLFVKVEARDDSLKQSFLPLCLPMDLSSPLEFCDDTWDGGSIADAFSEISITTGHDSSPVVNSTVTKKAVVSGLLIEIGQGCTDFMDAEHHRVLVSSVSPVAGRQGVVKGDVVTHINGREFKGTCQDLEDKIKDSVDKNGSFTLVLNADRSVAEALRNRAPKRFALLSRRFFSFP